MSKSKDTSARRRATKPAHDLHTLGDPDELRAQLLETITPRVDFASATVQAIVRKVLDRLIDIYAEGGTLELERAMDDALKAMGHQGRTRKGARR